jgi:cytochrome c oxidase assembly protein subunit 15
MVSNVSFMASTFCQRRHGWAALGFLFITMVWGAFVAGMDAGKIYNEWPHMGQGNIIPSDMWFLSPMALNIVENAAAVQFVHRWLAVGALVIIATFAWRMKNIALGGMVFLQFALGIITLLSNVSIPYAAMHQAGAFILTALLLAQMYRIKTP